MSYNKEDLINYRLDKAEKSLEEAEVRAQLKHWDTVANRLYYACFYAITAYLAKEDLQAVTHKGIKAAFHKELIKNGLMSEKLGKFYSNLFNKRQEADYKDFVEFEKEVIQPMISESKSFLKQIAEIIHKRN